MIKKYWKWQFSRWWPILLIFSVVLVSAFFLTASVISLVESSGGRTGSIEYYYRSGAGIGVEIYIFAALAMITTFIMPFSVFAYRTKKQSVDVFYQAAYKPGTIKRIRILLGLIIIVASFTLAYIIGIAILGIRYAATPSTYTYEYGGSTIIQTRVYVNFAVYILAYFVILFIVVGQYFINCFLISLGDYVLDQIFLLIAGNIVLFLGIYAPFVLIQNLLSIGSHGNFRVSGVLYPIFMMPSPLPAFYFLNAPIYGLLRGHYMNEATLVVNTIAFIIFIGFSVGLCLFNLLQRDPSGEYANLRGARNKAVSLIPHGAALALGLLVASAFAAMFRSGIGGIGSIAVPLFGLTLFATAHYALLALWRHSFKPTRIDLTCFLAVNGLIDLLTILGIAVGAVNGY